MLKLDNYMEKEIIMTLNKIAQAVYDKKGFNILALEVKGISSLGDYVVIAEGNVDRHVQAIADNIIDELDKQGIQPTFMEGRAGGDWIVIDFSHIVVHLFMPGLREKYRLEELWREGKIIELDIVT